MGRPPGPPTASGHVEAAASAASAYALLTDLDVLADLAEETHAMRWRTAERAGPGAVFIGANRNGWRRWSTRCTVVEAEPGVRFGFDVATPLGPLGTIPVAHWAYDLEPLHEGRCRVTESTWDLRPGWFRGPAGLATGVSDRTAASRTHIDATLGRLAARVGRAQP